MIEFLIEKLIEYSKYHLYLQSDDVLLVKNRLYNVFKVKTPQGIVVHSSEVEKLQTPDSIIERIFEYAVSNNLANKDEADMFKTFIMDFVTPLPSVINQKFAQLENSGNIKQACDYFYDLCVKSNYVKKSDMDKNIKWRADFKDKSLEITINLSKPEKNNKEIQKLKNIPRTGYPKCVLCRENIGYEGALNYPARQTLRQIDIVLGGEKWFMQYSPYMYYDKHCVIINNVHTPMKVDKYTIKRLADFVDRFPYYFVGSNAALPIVGGSILEHEHFQGGEYAMPIQKAGARITVKTHKYHGVSVCVLDWYSSIVRLESYNRDSIINLANEIIDVWHDYSDESVEIFSKTMEQHNAVAPIIRKVQGKYILDLVLRNNRCNDTHPDGIFHAHKEYMNIKSEGIGLIESMGLFVLPSRLKKEIDEIKNILMSKNGNSLVDIAEPTCQLYKHKHMIEKLVSDYGVGLCEEEAVTAIKNYINISCVKILECTAVFKNDRNGEKAFDRFLGKIEF